MKVQSYKALELAIRNEVLAPIMGWPVLPVTTAIQDSIEFILRDQNPQGLSSHWYSRRVVEENKYKNIYLTNNGRHGQLIATFHPAEKKVRLMPVNESSARTCEVSLSKLEYIQKILVRLLDQWVENLVIENAVNFDDYDISHLIIKKNKSVAKGEAISAYELVRRNGLSTDDEDEVEF